MLDLGKYFCIAGKWGRWKYEKQLYKWWTLVPIWLCGGVWTASKAFKGQQNQNYFYAPTQLHNTIFHEKFLLHLTSYWVSFNLAWQGREGG